MNKSVEGVEIFLRGTEYFWTKNLPAAVKKKFPEPRLPGVLEPDLRSEEYDLKYSSAREWKSIKVWPNRFLGKGSELHLMFLKLV